MSFEAAAWAIRRRTRTATAKLVLIAMADCHNADSGRCDPGNTYLADLAQCTKRSVINAVEELESLGYITSEKSNGRSTNYRLNLRSNRCNDFTGAKNSPVKNKQQPVKSETPTGENDNTSFSIQPVRTKNKTNEENVGVRSDSRSVAKPVKACVDDYALANLMLGGVVSIKPDFKIPNLDTWAEHCRKMRELDGRTPDAIRKVFLWANRDSFWQTNILSPAKLREKFDQLELQMLRPQRSQAMPAGSQRTRDISAIDVATDTNW